MVSIRLTTYLDLQHLRFTRGVLRICNVIELRGLASEHPRLLSLSPVTQLVIFWHVIPRQ